MTAVKHNIKLIESYEDVKSALDDYKDTHVVFLDTETQGLDPFRDKLLLIQLYAVGKEPIVIRAKDLSERTRSLLRDFMQPVGHRRELVIHNASFDLRFLAVHIGIEVDSPLIAVFDTQIAEAVLNAGKVYKLKPYCSLKNVVIRRINGVVLNKDITAQFIGHPGNEFTEEQINYAVEDILYLSEIRRQQIEEANKYDLVPTLKLEFELVKHVVRMYLNGVEIDREHWERILIREIAAKGESYENLAGILTEYSSQQSFFGEIPFNLGSPTQLLSYLQNDMGMDIEDTNEQTLSYHGGKVCEAILEYREHEKMVSAFGYETLAKINHKTHRMHPEFNQCFTATGRFSSDTPNVQQIPSRGNGAEIRECFVATKGYKMVTCDYSQIELRILAELSQEPLMIDAYIRGFDGHTATASTAFGKAPEDVTSEQRKIAKIINFATVYGGGPRAISKGLLQVISEEEAENILMAQFDTVPGKEGPHYSLAKAFIAQYFVGFPRAKEYLDKSGKESVWNRYSETPLGRKRFYIELDREGMTDEERKEVVGSVERRGKNHAIQGCSADITKKAIILLGNYFRDNPEYKGRTLLTVHDEIITEVLEDKAEEFLPIQQNLMVDAAKDYIKSIPVLVDGKASDHWEK